MLVSYASRGSREGGGGRRFSGFGKPRYLVIALLIILAARQPYTYDPNGNPVPYHGSVSATPSWSENCGTPDAPQRCPAYRPRPAKQVSAPLSDYN
jgi:hypothetical protein